MCNTHERYYATPKRYKKKGSLHPNFSSSRELRRSRNLKYHAILEDTSEDFRFQLSYGLAKLNSLNKPIYI